MVTPFILVGLLVFGGLCGILCLIRGPGDLDRVLVVDYLSVLLLAALGVVFFLVKDTMILDLSIVLALVGFFSTLVLARTCLKNTLQPVIPHHG